MENKYYKQSVQRLDFLSQNKIDNMKKNDIFTLGQLSNTKKEFLNNSGTQFDPEIVKVFLEILDTKFSEIDRIRSSK